MDFSPLRRANLRVARAFDQIRNARRQQQEMKDLQRSALVSGEIIFLLERFSVSVRRCLRRMGRGDLEQ